eukprot:scaffold24881_cov51-Attheya_sp.AAC.1
MNKSIPLILSSTQVITAYSRLLEGGAARLLQEEDGFTVFVPWYVDVVIVLICCCCCRHDSNNTESVTGQDDAAKKEKDKNNAAILESWRIL